MRQFSPEFNVASSLIDVNFGWNPRKTFERDEEILLKLAPHEKNLLELATGNIRSFAGSRYPGIAGIPLEMQLYICASLRFTLWGPNNWAQKETQSELRDVVHLFGRDTPSLDLIQKQVPLAANITMPDMEGLYSLAKQRGLLVEKILSHPHNSQFMKMTSALQLHWALLHTRARNNLKGLTEKDRKAFHNYLLKSHVFELTSYAVSILAVEQQLWQLTQKENFNDAFWERAFLKPYAYVQNPITPANQEEVGKLLKQQLLEGVRDARKQGTHTPMDNALRKQLENDAKTYCQIIIRESCKAVGANEDVLENLLGISYQQITNLTQHLSADWANIVAMYVSCSARLPTSWDAVDAKMNNTDPYAELEDYEEILQEHQRLVDQQLRFEQDHLQALQQPNPPEMVIDEMGNPGVRVNRDFPPPSDTQRGTNEQMSYIEVEDFSQQGVFPHTDFIESTKQNLREKGLLDNFPVDLMKARD